MLAKIVGKTNFRIEKDSFYVIMKKKKYFDFSLSKYNCRIFTIQCKTCKTYKPVNPLLETVTVCRIFRVIFHKCCKCE